MLVLCMVGILMLAACAQQTQTPPPQGGEQPTGQTATPPAGGETPTGVETPTQVPVESERVAEARRLFQDGDFEGAITILEGLAATEPSPVVNNLLIQTHGTYAMKVSEMQDVDPLEANTVLYSHVMRVLELDPANAEAQQGLDQVKAWFESNQKPLPETVDPLAFIAVPEEAEGETETEEAQPEEPEAAEGGTEKPSGE